MMIEFALASILASQNLGTNVNRNVDRSNNLVRKVTIMIRIIILR